MSKKLWFGLAGLAAALVLALVAALLLVDAERFRPTLQAQLEKVLQRPVTLGPLTHSIFPLALAARDLKIGEDPRFGQGTFLSADELRVRANLWTLLRGRVEITGVEAVEPKVELIRRNGVWNYSSVGGAKQTEGSGAPMQLGRVEIVGAQIATTLDAGPRTVYPKTNVTLSGIGPGVVTANFNAAGEAAGISGSLQGQAKVNAGAVTGSFSVSEARMGKSVIGRVESRFDVLLTGGNTEIRALDVQLGKVAVAVIGTVHGDRLALEVTMPRAPVADLVQLAAAFGQGLPAGLQANGQLEGKIRLEGTTVEPKVTGRIEAGDLTLNGGAAKQEVRSRAVTIDLLPDAIRSSPFEVTCGATKLSGYFSVRDYATKPLLESAIITENAGIADLLQIAQAYGATDGSLQASGKATLRLRVHGGLAKGVPLQFAGKGMLESAVLKPSKASQPISVDRAEITFPSPTEGKVSAGRLEYGKTVLTQLQSNFTYRQKVLRLEPFQAGLYGGASTGSIVVDTRGQNAAITLDTRLEKIESSLLLAAISSLPRFISGPLGGRVQVSYAPKGNEDPLQAMVGNLAIKFAAGQLHTTNLLGELGGLAKFVGGPKFDERFTSFVSMQGEVEVDKGVARTNGLRFDLKDAQATLTGGMNFVDQSLNLKLLSVLEPKLSEAVGGGRIGGILTTAVRNAAGQLIIPALVGGTFARPRITPDPAALAKLKLETVMPAITKGPSAVIDIIKSGKPSVDGVLDILRGGKPKK